MVNAIGKANIMLSRIDLAFKDVNEVHKFSTGQLYYAKYLRPVCEVGLGVWLRRAFYFAP